MTITADAQTTTPDTTSPAAVPDNLGHLCNDLTFERTVDRRLVHRTDLSEVFVTDGVGTEDGFAVAAQLPASHAYYGDHTARYPGRDALLLLECARQAETMGMHRFLGAPTGTGFLLQNWSLDLRPLQDLDLPDGPVEMVITDEPTVRRSGGRVRGADHHLRLSLGAELAGTVEMTVAYLPTEAYRLIRPKRRGSAPPMSNQITPGGESGVCEPNLVGRRSPDNVLLQFPQVLGDQSVSRLRSMVNHPSLFDHPQDHVPGMTLMEAARQAALLAAGEFGFGPPEYVAPIAFEAEFSSYTELDRATTIRAERPYATDPDRCAVRVAFEQGDDTTATATVGLLRVTTPQS